MWALNYGLSWLLQEEFPIPERMGETVKGTEFSSVFKSTGEMRIIFGAWLCYCPCVHVQWGLGRGTEESPELPLISANAVNVPHCAAVRTCQPYFPLSLRGWTCFRLEQLMAMKTSTACLLHERLAQIYVKEWLYTTYSGTFSKTYAGEKQMHTWFSLLQYFLPNF